MTDAPHNPVGSSYRWAIAAAVVVVLLVATAGGLYWELYVPRRESLANAIAEGDVGDVSRWVRSRRDLLESGDFGVDEVLFGGGRFDLDRPGIRYWSFDVDGTMPPLAFAIVCDDEAVGEKLLRLGADPNRRRGGGAVPSVFELLMRANPAPGSSFEPEAEAARRDQVHRWAALLIEHGADVSRPTTTPDRSTPLLLAITADDAELIDLLLAHGADVTVGDARGMTPLMVATLGGRFELADRFLSRGADVNALVERDGSAGEAASYALVHMAIVQRTPLETLRWLLDHGADTDSPARLPYFTDTFDAQNAAHLAWTIGDWEMFVLLSDHGAALPANVRNPYGQTPLHWAVQRRAATVARRLLAAGADPNAADAQGDTPAKLAAESSDPAIRALFAGFSSAAPSPEPSP